MQLLRQAESIVMPPLRTSARRPEPGTRVTRARGRLRAFFNDEWIADSTEVTLVQGVQDGLVAYFPLADVRFDLFEFRQRLTQHPELGLTTWYAVSANGRTVEWAAWHHVEPPAHAAEFTELVALSWDAMDGFYDNEQRIVRRPSELDGGLAVLRTEAS